MKYFITGATGFVGGEIVRQLVKAGHEVRAVVRDPQKAKWMEELGVKLYKGDVTEKESMREGMTGVDGVFHVAGWYKLVERTKGEAYAVNVKGTTNVLELMQELKIPKGVYTSTCAVNSNTQGKTVDETYRFSGAYRTTYERTKGEAHRIAEKFIQDGLPLVIAMPGMIYGPNDTSAVRSSLIDFLKGKLPAIPAKSVMQWTRVEDCAQAHIAMMEKGRAGEAYIISGEKSTVVELYRMAAEISSAKMPLILPDELLLFMSKLSRPFDRWLPDTFTSEGLVSIAGLSYLSDDGKARRELGFAPRPIREGWTETVRHEMKLLGM
ncbi:MAG: NAD-dependent epimerase/dehydratase family protein [Anaerolineales bacterium]|nr:MAG: NAD-dependent epimerase/dehydratase family protein [Anaerolineales bacterium]